MATNEALNVPFKSLNRHYHHHCQGYQLSVCQGYQHIDLVISCRVCPQGLMSTNATQNLLVIKLILSFTSLGT